MKQVFKHFIIITALLFVSLGAFAGGEASVTYKLDGGESSADVVGTVTYLNSTSTITVTPNEGYYLTAEDITVYKMINGQYAQGRKREPAYNTPVAITASDPDADPCKATTYTFTKPGDEYDYEIIANFHVRTSIENATVTGLEESYTYTGEAIKPVVTVKVDNNTLTLNIDYRAFYTDSINASTDQVKGKITLYGIRKYTGTKQIEYTIAKADPTLTFSSATATYTFGQEFTKPTLTTTPAGLAVTYASSNENVAKVDEASGDITPVAVSTEAITITASFAGNSNYNAMDATYALTVAKGTAVVTKAPTAKENLTYTGEALALINAGECTTGNMQYKVGTDGTYSANIPTGTDAKTYTVYYKDAGNSNYNASDEASITVTIEEADEPQPEQDKYALWIGTEGNMTKVTAENTDDILGDGEKDSATGEVSKSGSIVFYPDNHTLFIAYEGDENAEDLSIESHLPILTIYVRDNCNSKLKRIYYNNEDDAEGTEAGTLEFTGEYPTKGKLFLENKENESAIFGFSNVTFNENSKLAVIEPDDAEYRTLVTEGSGQQIEQMIWMDKVAGFIPANKITISAPLEKADEVVFDRMSFTQKDKNGNPLYDESGDPIMIDMTNGIVGIKGKGEALVTLPLSNDPNSDEGPDNSDGIWGLAVQSTMTDAEALDVAKKVAEGNLTPSGSQFANLYKGQTILVPEGKGVITVKAVWEEGYEFHLLIGESEDGLARFAEGDANIREIEPILGGWTEGVDVYMNVIIKYDMPAPTYCYLYLVKIDKARSIIPIGKREKAHGKVVSINVNIVKKAPGNPASEISGGAIPKSEDIIKDDDIITGIKVINNTDHSRVGNNKWYNLNGQQIDLPTKQGLYIINGKKIIIK